MKRIIILFALLVFVIQSVFSQSPPVKREFRGVWVATVLNLDWPTSIGNVAVQKQQLINQFDQFKAANINAVVFQVRPECDALYDSPYEPWSYWLTGQQGRAPEPYYDPLSFAIEEAHKRGMELHAWLNPYRAKHSSSTYGNSATHVTNQNPDWVMSVSGTKILDPGLPQVREFILKVFMDITRRYNVDGIHIDDYFYVEGITTQDATTFANYPRGFTNLFDWRRDNVNILIKAIDDSIKSVKPNVKWGVSPRGIWRNGVPPGIIGNDNYSTIYCDAINWLQNKALDYINPQLYWPFGGGQDYGKLMPWWADSAARNNRHLYVGQAAYRISIWTSSSEMPNQIRLNRTNPKCQGSIFYNTTYLLGNPKGFLDSLLNDFYRYPALTPVMNWKEMIPPNNPINVRLERKPGTGVSHIVWDKPTLAIDGDTASRYVVYRFNTNNITSASIEDASKMLTIEGNNYYTPTAPPSSDYKYFVITAVDQNSNESELSNVLELVIPLAPTLSVPVNQAINQRDTIIFKWSFTPGAGNYHLQVSSDPTFSSNLIVNSTSVTDTFYLLTNVTGQSTYYWRTKAENGAGISNFSSVNSFTTGFPIQPVLMVPAHATTNVPLSVDLKWGTVSAASSYNLQISSSLTFNDQTILLTVDNISDTTYQLSNLLGNKLYYWRVRGVNEFGASIWSTVFGFRTENPGDVGESHIPSEFLLHQNFPNPFNPSTVIKWEIADAAHVTLKVYDLLGNEIVTLEDEYKNPGVYTSTFTTDDKLIPSGIYFYKIQAGKLNQIRKMILLK
ncbi:MAG: family 10 glycosylhydrolase [Ignavibacteria bacterium]|nr:family 10 glycosylhydrolase [Ignavibacteria bacterium]